jgi:hypothetical protein
MKKAFAAASLTLALFGCGDMKDHQRPDIVGDSKTKIFYKNVPTNESKIPSAQREYFKSQDEAREKGYASSQEGGADSTDDK